MQGQTTSIILAIGSLGFAVLTILSEEWWLHVAATMFAAMIGYCILELYTKTDQTELLVKDVKKTIDYQKDLIQVKADIQWLKQK